MSATEIINQLPKLTEAERCAVLEKLCPRGVWESVADYFDGPPDKFMDKLSLAEADQILGSWGLSRTGIVTAPKFKGPQ